MPIPMPARPLAVSVAWGVQAAFVAALALESLDAYSLMGVPIPWLGQLVIAAAVLLSVATGRVVVMPAFASFVVLALWAVVCTAVNALTTDYAALMPSLATTPYPVFIGLRLFHLVGFGATLYVTYWLLRNRGEEAVIRILVILGACIAAASIYIYLAHLYGLPEPPRNRMGTAGRAQPVVFTYAFHRALGTFREPAYLASWLVVPLMLALTRRRGVLDPAVILMTVALLLTGSLAGIVGAAMGFLLAMLVGSPLHRGRLRRIVTVAGIGAVALVAFNLLVVEQVNLFGVLSERIGRLLESGMRGSNRGYIYRALDELPLPVIGVGLGHSNLLLSQALESRLVTSFLSLYLNIAYSLGLPGLLLLAWFVLSPLVHGIRHWGRLSRGVVPFWSLAGYFAWLVMYGFRSEELASMFAVVMAVLLHSTVSRRPSPRPADR